jgi:tRNA-specific 2-thiouridylase
LVKGVFTEVKSKTAKFHFYEPERAVTEGQAAVFYYNDEVLGGGTVS